MKFKDQAVRLGYPQSRKSFPIPGPLSNDDHVRAFGNRGAEMLPDHRVFLENEKAEWHGCLPQRWRGLIVVLRDTSDHVRGKVLQNEPAEPARFFVLGLDQRLNWSFVSS
jgi:hypothetical protein